MKKYLLLSLTTMILTFSAIAQDDYDNPAPKAPRWTPANGYWIIKGNIKTPMEHTVMFYTNEGSLIYSELVSGVKLDLRRRKTLMKLKKALDTTMLAWEKQKVVKENEMIVMNSFKHRQ